MGTLKNFDRNLLRAGPAASLLRSWGWSQSPLSEEVTVRSVSEPPENLREPEEVGEESLASLARQSGARRPSSLVSFLAGQLRSRGCICTSTILGPGAGHYWGGALCSAAGPGGVTMAPGAGRYLQCYDAMLTLSSAAAGLSLGWRLVQSLGGITDRQLARAVLVVVVVVAALLSQCPSVTNSTGILVP